MSIKLRLEKLEGKIKKSSNYAEIIRKHASGGEGMLVHTIIALCINTVPEHKNSIKARNYLEWINSYNSKVIDAAYDAIQDLVAAGIYTVVPTLFIPDGRNVSSMMPPYPYLCNAEQILHYSDSKDTKFWTDLQ